MLADTIREMQALVKQRDANFAAAVGTPAPGGVTWSGSFAIGTPVLDLVTGETGVVVNGKRENVAVPPSGNNGG